MRALVDDVLDCVALECPEAYLAMQRALGERRLDLGFAHESFALALAPALAPPPGSSSEQAIAIRTTARTLHDILIGERDPLDAILADELTVHAGVDDLVAAAEAGLFFVKGAARCTSLEPMLRRLKDLAEGEGEP